MQVFGERSSCWSSLTHEASFSIFPALTHKLLCYLFATPTVARPKQEEIYSSSVNRSGKFADGCDFAESNIRFIISDGHALLHNRCRPSMSASKKYHSFILIRLASPQTTISWRELRQRMWCFCLCKNGESDGNCAHLAALLTFVGRIQGTLNDPNHPGEVALSSFLQK